MNRAQQDLAIQEIVNTISRHNSSVTGTITLLGTVAGLYALAATPDEADHALMADTGSTAFRDAMRAAIVDHRRVKH